QLAFQFVGKSVNGGERLVTRRDQRLPVSGRQVGGQRHQADVEHRINRARGGNGELGVQPNRLLQVLSSLGQHGRHQPQTGSGRQGACAGGSVLLLEQGKNRVAAFVHVQQQVGVDEAQQ